MRIATFKLNGQRHVGQVSADGKHVTAFALTEDQAHHGAQPIIDALVSGHALPELVGTPHDITHVHLEAPLPVPRRNVWCVPRCMPPPCTASMTGPPGIGTRPGQW